MAADRVPGGFGATLRDARERRGVSLRQIANATKISIGALEALERNDVSRLPGGIFSRAFVRSYAIEVGLDPDRTIQEFIASLPSDAVAGGHAASQHVEDGISVESERKRAGTFLWLIAVSIPIAGALVYYATLGRGGGADPRSTPSSGATPTGRGSARSDAAAPAGQTPRAAPLDAEPAATNVGPAAVVTAPATTAPTPTSASPTAAAASRQPAAPVVAAAAAADRLTIGLSVRRPCYVSATVDGRKTIDRLLQVGERQTIQVTREIVLTAGDASAIALNVNGEPARPLGAAGQVVTVRINPGNYRDFVQSR